MSYFISVAFSSRLYPSEDNLMFAFLKLQLQFVIGHFYVFTFLFLILFFVILVVSKRDLLIGKFLLIFGRLLKLIFIGLFSSLVFLVLIAILHANILSIFSYVSHKLIGFENRVDKITQYLEEKGRVPLMVFGNENRVLNRSLVISQAGKDNFYSSYIIPIIPNYMIIPMNNIDQDLVMVGSNLVVNKINSESFEKIAPIVSYLMIKDYFPRSLIKKYPVFSIMDKNSYLEFRKGNFDDEVKNIDTLIKSVERNIEDLNFLIGQKENDLLKKENSLEKERKNKEKEYIKCVNEGYYKSGIFFRINSKEYCLEKRNEKEMLLKSDEKEIENLKELIDKSRNKILDNQKYLDFYSNQRKLIKKQIDFIPSEYAVFNPPNIIKITKTSQENQKALADVFVVLIHEYLHFSAYNNEGKSLGSLFYTEGLTEYFARKIVEKNFGVKTNVAYPANVKIIEQMMKRINEEDMEYVYFNSDNKGLEKIIDMVYEDGFFSRNVLILEKLHYSSNNDEILSLANNVMEKMGGKKLTKEDIVSDNETFW